MRSLLLIPLLAGSLLAQEFGKEPMSIPEDQNPVTTESGLVYSILKAGTGTEKPAMGDTVKVHYKGWLEDGTSFDSSFKRGQPASFKLGQVVQGWNEGLTHVTEGGIIKLTIPSDLGYGDMGRPPTIPGKATLIFEIHLIELTAAPKRPDFEWNAELAKETSPSEWPFHKTKSTEGAPCTDEDTAVFHLSGFGSNGKCFFSTTDNGKAPEQPLKNLNPFVKELVGLVKAGEVAFVKVPADKTFNRGQKPAEVGDDDYAIWRLELVDVKPPLPMPEFRLPNPEKAITTASGLVYEVIQAGEGEHPTAASRVSCHYAGWLMSGTSFDSSYSRGAPTTFPLQGVIAGWTEGVQLMKPGAIFLFQIPGKLAYGANPPPGSGIGPNDTLIFQIQLMEIL